MAFDKNIDIVSYIKEAADPEILLKALGFTVTKRTYKELRAPCIIHGGDNPTAFRFGLEKKTFTCFTRACQTEGSKTENDVIGLVRKVKKCTFQEAVEYLAELFGVELTKDWREDKIVDTEAVREFYREKEIEDLVRQTNKIRPKEVMYLPEEVIQAYKEDRGDYFTQLGVTEEIQDYFDVGYYEDDFGDIRASIPIRDVSGQVVSISGRTVSGDTEPRYKLTQDFDKKSVVYNLNNAIKYGEIFNSTAIVVEGFKACWAVHAAGFPNVVACIGAYLLEPQAALLSRSGFLNCVLFLDGDETGKKASITSLPVSSKYMKTKSVDLYRDFPGMSPDDFGEQDLFSILSQMLKEF